MLKLLVICCLYAVVSAAPGYIHSGVIVPPATSYSSRVDVHSSPIVTKAVVAAPFAYHGPVISSIGHGYGIGYDSIHGLGYSGLGFGGDINGIYGGLNHGISHSIY
ncbi:hypothetical protein WA026_013128 [Henosepilachna vigintioctopunctata]|uniref:Uncharacterized protein n=1 Tax=Henosepilachna vigintioctopunctata TaxID=420089 RepID=A0AAW1UI90_9CUCU